MVTLLRRSQAFKFLFLNLSSSEIIAIAIMAQRKDDHRTCSTGTGRTCVSDEESTHATSSKERANEGKQRPVPVVTTAKFQESHQSEVDKTIDKFLSMNINEKRKLYKCRYVTLEEIDTWPKHYEKELKDDSDNQKWRERNEEKIAYVDVRPDLNSKIALFHGNITNLEIDAIANAANESLLGGGGVDGAIHSAAGSNLRSECQLLGGCSAGQAKISCGYKLPAKYVVHTVGPRGEKPDVLKNCYFNSLELLKANNLKSIAFPCISTGIFGYPNENAARVALKTVRTWLEKEEYAKNIDRIIMSLFLQKDVDIYNEQMQLFFPVSDVDEEDDD